MIDVAKKRLPRPAVIVLLYLSYCAVNLYATRGALAFYGENYSLPGWFVNDIWAFFIGGILTTLIYALVSRGAMRSLGMRVGPVPATKIVYGVDLSVIAANITLFALKFVYIAAPLYAQMLDVILNPAVTILFIALYLVYVYFIDYVDKSRFGTVLASIMAPLCAVYGLIAVINIILAVV